MHSNTITTMSRHASRRHRRIQHHGASVTAKSGRTTILLLLLALLVNLHCCHGQAMMLRQDDDCRNNLYTSDADGDRRVDSEEYVTFVKLEGPEGFLPNVESFVQLPIMLQSNFYTLACLCRNDPGVEGSGCCVGDNAHLNTNGTAPGEVPTPEQDNYLNLVCTLTARAIDLAVEEQTDSPTEFVTEAPSAAPSILATTLAPTLSPVSSSPGTPSPTTPAPATAMPTAAPSVAPVAPTDAPIAPTDTPSKPTFAPTGTLSPTQFFEPVPVIIKTTYSIIVPIEAIEDIPSSQYEEDLIASMDIVSQDVADDLNGFSGGDTPQRRRKLSQDASSQRRRRLEVLVNLPTAIDSIEGVGFTSNPQLINGTFVRGPCPLDLGDPATDFCGEVSATIELNVTSPDDNPLLVYGLFSAGLDRAILNGDLVAALAFVAPDSVVEIASGQPSNGGGLMPTVSPTVAPAPGDDDTRSGLSTGAIAGIAVGAFAFLLLIWFAFSHQRSSEKAYQEKKLKAKNKNAEEQDPEALIPAEGDNDGASGQKAEADGSSSKKQDAATTATVASTANKSESAPKQSNLGQQLRAEEEEKRMEVEEMDDDAAAMLAATVPYIDSPKKEKEGSQRIEIEGSEDILHDNSATKTPHDARSTGNISHESEAGWSEAYTSSMGSVSEDEMLPDKPDSKNEQKMILSISASSPLAQGSPKGDESSPDDKFGELEKAIMTGNWAAVGATAAALASMQEQSTEDVSRSSTGLSALESLRSQSWKNQIDNDKAAQLDQLIEAGDWEGIIIAAAKFEAEATGATNVYNIGNGSGPSSEGSQNELMVHEDSSDNEDETTGFYSESTSKSSAAAPTKMRTSDELRAEVRALVETVVPEEVDHVDEMLEQFVGREDELIETLETMQERAEAQNSASGITAKSLFKGKIELD